MTAPTRHQPHCPFCLSAIRPEDDSVVCSACGIPHHRECWEINGDCTTYGCRGFAVRLDADPGGASLHTRPGQRLPSAALAREDVRASEPPLHRPTLPVSSRPPGAQTRLAHRLGLAIVILIATSAAGLFMLVATLPTPPSASPEEGAKHASAPARPATSHSSWRIVRRRCNLHLRPDALAPWVAELGIGARVAVLQDGVPWVHVQLSDGPSGYLLSEDLAKQADPAPPRAPALSPPPRPSDPNARIVTQRCSLLSTPGNDAKTVAWLWPGEIVALVRVEGQWALVRSDRDTEGYVPRSALIAIQTKRPSSPATSPHQGGPE